MIIDLKRCIEVLSFNRLNLFKGSLHLKLSLICALKDHARACMRVSSVSAVLYKLTLAN